MGVVNWRIGAVVKFHDVPHGFMEGQGMRNDFFKAKLIHNKMEMREEVLYEVFLNLQNANNDLYREWCIDILVSYGIGPQKERILRFYLDHFSMLA